MRYEVHQPSALMGSPGELHTWGQQDTQQSHKLLALHAFPQPPQANPGADTQGKDAWIPVAHVRAWYLQDNNWYTEIFFYFFSLFFKLVTLLLPMSRVSSSFFTMETNLLKTSCWARFTQWVQQYKRIGKHAALSIFKRWASTGDSSGTENTSEGKII